MGGPVRNPYDVGPLLEKVRHGEVIPRTVYVRPCWMIDKEAVESSSGLLTIADRYSGLTTELPLAEGAMMQTHSDGETVLVRRLRATAPWLEPAIGVIDR